MTDLSHPPGNDRPDRSAIVLRLTIAHGRDAVVPVRGRQILALSLPPIRVLAFLFVVVLVAFTTPIDGTSALLSVSAENPVNAVQANTVRLAMDAGDAPAFTIPALLPGESVDRVIGVRSTGTGDARVELAVVPETSSAFVADGASGLALSVDRCTNGVWATTTPVTGVPTPPPAGALLACVATPGAVPSVNAVYRGPIVPRGVTAPGAPTSTPVPIPLLDRLGAGDRADVRVRVSLPEEPAGVAPSSNRQGGVAFEWRATGLGTNLNGTPLAGRPIAPVTATATAVVVVAPSATATSTAIPTSTFVPTSTATASATATVPAYAGYALAFDGMSDAVRVGWTQAVGPVSGRSAWTVEAWVNPADLTVARVIYAESSSMGDTLAIRLAPGSGGAARLEVGLRHGGALEWTGADLPQGAVVAGAWSHLGASFTEGVRLDLAANGLPVASVTSAAATTKPEIAATDAWLARPGATSTGTPFVGTLDEVRVWSVARTYAAADTTFVQQLAGGEPGLALHFPMSAYASTGADARGLTIVDRSGNSVSGTIVGGARWVTSRAPVDRPAAPHSLRLTASSDLGASTTDGITKATMISVVGRAVAGSSVAVSIDGAPIGFALASDNAAVAEFPASAAFTIPTTVAAGTHSITAIATDAFGMASMASATATFVVDTTVPTAGAITLADTDGSTTDGIVRTAMPVFTLDGTSDAGYVGAGVATVQLQVAPGLGATTGFANNGQPAAQSGGASSFVATTLADGPYTARVAVTDVAGNVAYTASVNVTVDTTPPTVSEVQRQLIAETSSTWNAPRYTVTTTDATSVASVLLQIGASATGTFTDSGSLVTQPYSGNIFVVPGPTISGTQWVRMRVTDVVGNVATTSATMVTTWDASAQSIDWTVAGSASLSGGYLILTPNSGSLKGGAYFHPLVATSGQVSVSFDLEVNGSADGVCVPFFSEPSAFLTGDAGGSLGCMGMTEGTIFVGISEYHHAIEIGTQRNGVATSTPAFGFANTTSLVRFTIILTPTGGSTLIDVQAQIGSGAPQRVATATLTGTLPGAGTLVGITGATGGLSASHMVRNIVVSGS
jgi:hypothetical protein